MKYKETAIDPNLAGIFDQTEFESSQKYQYEKHSFKIVHSVFDFVFDLCFWMLFIWVWVWNRIDSFTSTFALCADTPYINDMVQAYLFAVTLIMVSMAVNVPFTIYDTFVIEEKYGFNKTTRGTFLKDQVKTFVLTLILYAILIPTLLYIIEKSGSAMIPTLAGVCIFGVILINVLVPTCILPIFF